MYSAFFCLLVLVSALTCAFSQPARNDFSDKIADVQEIRKSMLEIERAFVSRDPEPFERIYTGDYIGIRSRPVFNAREQLIAMVRWDSAAIKAGKKLDFETLSYESDSPAIRIFGQTAVVNVFKKNLWRYRDKKCLTRYQATEVWLKRENLWHLAAGHMTTFQCDPMPWQPPHPAVSAIRPETKTEGNNDGVAEREIRELLKQNIGKNSEAFSSEYVSTNLKGEVGPDKNLLLNALKADTNRQSEQFRDDVAFQIFDDTAIYIFRLRFSSKEGETQQTSTQRFSVVLVKQSGLWRIVASHAVNSME